MALPGPAPAPAPGPAPALALRTCSANFNFNFTSQFPDPNLEVTASATPNQSTSLVAFSNFILLPNQPAFNPSHHTSLYLVKSACLPILLYTLPRSVSALTLLLTRLSRKSYDRPCTDSSPSLRWPNCLFSKSTTNSRPICACCLA